MRLTVKSVTESLWN